MLVEFSVANFRSIRERQTLSLVAGSDSELSQSHVIGSEAPGTPKLLRSAVIYGPNASGKSNLIMALAFAEGFILNSARRGQKGDKIARSPFLMDEASAQQPTEFEFVFVEGGVRYQYGFSVTDSVVVSEWLMAYPKGYPQTWFERGVADDDWSFGPNFRGQRRVWKEATRDNALFLSTAMQLNAEQLVPVFDWFRVRLRTIMPYARVSHDFSAKLCETDGEARTRILDFLKSADLGVDRLVVERRGVDTSRVAETLPEAIRSHILKELEGQDYLEVRVAHRTEAGREVLLDLEQESGGTQKLFALAGPWFDVLDNGWVLFVDELDTSLHPVLLKQLVRLFHDPRINKKGAQLVFSTHDTSIFERGLFRRDQIWFMEKDKTLASQLVPLTDFSPRKAENIRLGYLQGRYGGLPLVAGLDG